MRMRRSISQTPPQPPPQTTAPLDRARGQGHLTPAQGPSVPTHSTASAFSGDLYLRLSFHFDVFKPTGNGEAVGFPADQVVKTPCFHRRGCGFAPRSGKFHMQHSAAKKIKQTRGQVL